MKTNEKTETPEKMKHDMLMVNPALRFTSLCHFFSEYFCSVKMFFGYITLAVTYGCTKAIYSEFFKAYKIHLCFT